MATPTKEGLREEVDSLKDRLRQAQKDKDSDKERYLNERIRRVENEIDNLSFHDSIYKK